MGIFATIYAFLGAVRFLGPLGSDQLVLRRVAGEYEGKITPESQALLDTSTALSLSVAVLITLVIFGFFYIQKPTDPLNFLELIAVAAAIPAFSLIGVFISQIRAMGSNLQAQTPEALGLHLVFLLIFAIASWLEMVGRQSVLICLSISCWLIVMVYLVMRRRHGVIGFLFPSAKDIFCMARNAASNFQALFFTTLSTRAPIFIAALLGGAPTAALMDIALRFGKVASMTTTSVATTFSPKFAKNAYSGQVQALSKSLRQACFLAAVPAFTWLAFLVCFGPVLIDAYLPAEYSQALYPMLLAAVASSINAAFGLSTNALIMVGRAKVVSQLSLAQLVVIVIASITLVPTLSGAGIVVGMILGSLIRDGGGLAYFIKQRMVLCGSVKV